MAKKNAHCSYCGQLFEAEQPWPRRCSSCGETSFINPLPVAVMLIPVGDGLVVIRRGIPPRQGLLALPGGYIGVGESWQEAGAREVLEETGITLAPDEIEDFCVLSAPDGTVLIFGLAQPRTLEQLPAFEPTDETSERVLLLEPVELAFELHTRATKRFFAKRMPSKTSE